MHKNFLPKSLTLDPAKLKVLVFSGEIFHQGDNWTGSWDLETAIWSFGLLLTMDQEAKKEKFPTIFYDGAQGFLWSAS